MDNKNEVLIYEDKDGITKVNVTFTDEDIWLTQSQLAEIYKTSRENITMHISNIYKDNELPKDSTCKKFLQVQNEGARSVKRTMKMQDWVEELDNQILLNRRKILEGNGKISHEEAIKKAEKEFQIYREREMKELQSDFDMLMKSLPNKKESE